MPDPDADLLETLLAKVMRLLAVHGDTPGDGPAGPSLSMAEGALLIDLAAAGEVTQQQLASRLHLDKSRVSRLCSALERKHLLARERDQANRRNLRVRITESGTAAAARLRQNWRERHKRMLTAMTADERQSLNVGLAALARELAALHSLQAGMTGHLPGAGSLAGGWPSTSRGESVRAAKASRR